MTGYLLGQYLLLGVIVLCASAAVLLALALVAVVHDADYGIRTPARVSEDRHILTVVPICIVTLVGLVVLLAQFVTLP